MAKSENHPKFTAAVVGAGNGGRLSLAALGASSQFEIVAVADLCAEARQTVACDYPSMRTFATHEEMFGKCAVDVVCVSTYPPTHEQITLDALAALPLKGILVEKPLGHTTASGRRLLDVIKAKRLPIAVPHGLLAKRTPVEIIERIARGDIGEVKLVEIQCCKWDIINAGIHWLHFFMSATGNEPIIDVLAQADKTTRTFRDGMQVETVAITCAQNRSGARVVMYTGDDLAVNVPEKETVFRLIGSAGTIEFYGWENGYLLNGERIAPGEFVTTGHQRHLETMAAQIEQGCPDYRLAESSLAALEICEAAYLSAEHGCRVKLPLAGFVPPAQSDWQPGQPYDGVGGGRDARRL